MFSIVIPTWNNLPFVKLCIEGIRQNSAFTHQVILHVNEGADKTAEWAEEQGIEYTFSDINIGICLAVNKASALAKNNYIVFMNDDMYPLPGWDKNIIAEIEKLDTDCFMLSSTMIEPYDTKNNCVIVGDYGRSEEDFKKDKLLKEFASLPKGDWSGSTWPPTVVHAKWWKKVGGYSEEFSPGMSSDNDFSMKMWATGCRIFKGVGSSRVYHFISKSTGRIKKNDGRKQFLQKWGMKQSTFSNFYLKRGAPYRGELVEPTFSPALIYEKILAYLKR